ncbi:MAG: GntR family transcriptional regulator [Rhodoglobus sp.]
MNATPSASVAERADTEKLSTPQRQQLLRSSLLELIATIDDGECLPPERALAERLGAARMTVRKELDRLIEENCLRRIPGKGTFVTRSHLLDVSAEGPLRNATVNGISIASARVIELRQTEAESRVAHHLQIAPSASITKVVRVCLIDSEPIAIERLYLPTHLFEILEISQFEAFDVNDVYLSQFGIRVTQTSQIIRATTIDSPEAVLLSAPAHSPAFYSTTTKTDSRDRVIEYSKAVYRGDRYRFIKTARAEDDPSRTDTHRVSESHFVIN